jgi:acyl-CoA thioester hydrolase
MHAPAVEPRAEEFPHRIVETLRFADTDRNGHITSSVFAICCQSGRLALLSDPAWAIQPPSSQFVLARLILDYRGEMHWPGAVEVGTRVERIGRSSVTLAQALFQNDRCVATAQSITVLTHAMTRRAHPIPHASVQRLQTFQRINHDPEPAIVGAVCDSNARLHVFPNGQSTHASPSQAPDEI